MVVCCRDTTCIIIKLILCISSIIFETISCLSAFVIIKTKTKTDINIFNSFMISGVLILFFIFYTILTF